MSLADIQQESHTVHMGKASFTVTGLSLNGLTTLVKTHVTEMEAVFKLLNVHVDNEDYGDLAMDMVRNAPGLAANIIAIAAGEPDYAEVIAKMPFPVQIEALESIGRLTFTEVGGVKKTVKLLLKIIGGIKQQPKK